jgi:hypothetical protein
VSFEDDMLINAHHVQHYLAITEELRRLHETGAHGNAPTAGRKSSLSLINYTAAVRPLSIG